MAKKNKWHSKWGPINFLNNEPEASISHFPASRLDDLKDCIHIFSMTFYKPQERLDLAKISHIRELRELTLDRCEVVNEQVLLTLPKLHTVNLYNCKLSAQQEEFFDEIEDDFLSKNLDKVNKLSDACNRATYGPAWGVKKTPQEHQDSRDLTSKLLKALVEKNWSLLQTEKDKPELENALGSLFEDNLPDWLFSGNISQQDCQSITTDFLKLQDPDLFNLIVKVGFGIRRKETQSLFFNQLLNHLDRLDGPIEDYFHQQTNFSLLQSCDADFAMGKLKNGHFSIINFLQIAPAEKFIKIYKLFLQDRVNFSDAHLVLYKKLLDIVSKSKAIELTTDIIDLIKYEKHTPDGDPVFVKKCLKAAAKLGNASHIPTLEEHLLEETREELKNEYALAKKRLMKNKTLL